MSISLPLPVLLAELPFAVDTDESESPLQIIRPLERSDQWPSGEEVRWSQWQDYRSRPYDGDFTCENALLLAIDQAIDARIDAGAGSLTKGFRISYSLVDSLQPASASSRPIVSPLDPLGFLFNAWSSMLSTVVTSWVFDCLGRKPLPSSNLFAKDETNRSCIT